MKYLMGTIYVFVFCILLGALYSASFNITQWGEGTRFMVTYGILIGSAGYWMIVYLDGE